MVCAGHDFAAPRRRDSKAWTVVAAVLNAGLRYEGREPCGCGKEPKFRPAPEPSCGHVESQQPEPARRSPTCWDAQTYKHPADLHELWLSV